MIKSQIYTFILATVLLYLSVEKSHAAGLTYVIKLRTGDCMKCYTALHDITLNKSLSSVLLVSEREKNMASEFIEISSYKPDTVIVSNAKYEELGNRIDSEFLVTDDDLSTIYFTCGLADLRNYKFLLENLSNPTFRNGSFNKDFATEGSSPHSKSQNEISLVYNRGQKIVDVLLQDDTAIPLASVSHKNILDINDSTWIRKLNSLFGNKFNYTENNTVYQNYYKENENGQIMIEPMINYSFHRIRGDHVLVFYAVNEIQRRVGKTNVDYRYRTNHHLMFLFKDSTLVTKPYFIPEKPSKNYFKLPSEVFYSNGRFLIGLQKNNVQIPWGNKPLGYFDTSEHIVTNVSTIQMKKPKMYKKASKKLGFDFTLLEISNDSNVLFNFSGHNVKIHDIHDKQALRNIKKLNIPFDKQFQENYYNFKMSEIPYYTNLAYVSEGVLIVRNLSNQIDILYYHSGLDKVVSTYSIGSVNGNSVPCVIEIDHDVYRFVYVNYETNELRYVDCELK